MTNHELNVKAASVVPIGRTERFTNYGTFLTFGQGLGFMPRTWSPATSIADAMDLLPLLPERKRGPCWIVKVLYRRDGVDVDLLGRPDSEGDREVVWARHDITNAMLPRTITEAFIAAMEASK